MNGLQDLINTLQKIEEAPEPVPAAPTTTDRVKPAPVAPAPAADPQRAAYDQFKADDAKNAAIETVKKYMSKPINQIGRLENLIDPATGFIYYGQAGMDATQGTPTKMPMKFMSQGDQASMMNAITTAGLKVVDNGGYAMIDPASLKTLGQAPAAPAAAPAPATGSAQKPANDFQPKIDRLKTILGLTASNATANTTIAPVMKESIFKSLIGKTLLESFDLQLSEAATPREEADAIWAELSKAMETPGALTPEQRKSIEELTTVYQQFQQNNPSAAAKPATPTAPAKTLAPVDPKVKQFQDEVKKLDPTSFPKYGADGRMGAETQIEIGKHPDIAVKYGLKSTKVAPPGTVGSDQKVAPAVSSASVAKDIPADVSAQFPADSKLGDYFWVNGQRYKLTSFGRGQKQWQTNTSFDWDKTDPDYQKKQAKYTGKDNEFKLVPAAAPAKVAESGFANDEVSRLVSLIHHR